MKLVSENKICTKRILPICDPVITSYTKHAHILSIIGSYKQTYPWIFSNYIQVYMNKYYKDNRADNVVNLRKYRKFNKKYLTIDKKIVTSL